MKKKWIKLKDPITQQVNFFQQIQTGIEAVWNAGKTWKNKKEMCARVVCVKKLLVEAMCVKEMYLEELAGEDVSVQELSVKKLWVRELCVCVKGLFVKELRGAEVSVQEPISVGEIAPDRSPCFKMTNWVRSPL